VKSDGLLTAKHFDDAMKNARRSVSKVIYLYSFMCVYVCICVYIYTYVCVYI